MAKKNKVTAQQTQTKELWDKHLKKHIAGFISPRAGQNEKFLARIDKAIQSENLDAAKEEFDWLKKTAGGFLFPIFVKHLIDPDKEDKSSNQTTVGNRTYNIPGPRLTERLEEAWEKFLTLIEQPAVSASS